ncbi:hypothetical protein HMPREF3192_00270 [Atopobium deltae]|uniref:Uncharacterized protein n=1 Tax=Atopobium deltae TaxID=1393034 RepID=A0A133XWT9_9ACTN|nr:hypothetical protein HMPREF3192_00270 [Atopobium deltae]
MPMVRRRARSAFFSFRDFGRGTDTFAAGEVAEGEVAEGAAVEVSLVTGAAVVMSEVAVTVGSAVIFGVATAVGSAVVFEMAVTFGSAVPFGAAATFEVVADAAMLGSGGTDCLDAKASCCSVRTAVDGAACSGGDATGSGETTSKEASAAASLERCLMTFSPHTGQKTTPFGTCALQQGQIIAPPLV